MSKQELIWEGSNIETSEPAGELLLEWPVVIRSGDPAKIHLTYLPYSGQDSSAEPKIDEQSLIAPLGGYFRVLLAKLELANMRHTPEGEISQALSTDNAVVFLWNLLPEQSGRFSGDVRLHLRFIPETDGQEQRKFLVLLPVEIEVRKLFLLNGPQVRIIGAFAVMFGLLIGFEDVFINELNTLLTRIKR